MTRLNDHRSSSIPAKDKPSHSAGAALDLDRVLLAIDAGADAGAGAKGEAEGGISEKANLAITPVNAIKDVFLRHRESLSQKSKAYTHQQMDILRSICNMVIKICTLYRIDPLSKVLKRHQQFIGDATKFLKSSQQEFAAKAEVCSSTEERYYNLVYTYQSVALLPIIAPRSKEGAL